MAYDRFQVSILGKMWRRNLFGGKYQPVEKLLSDVPKEWRNKARQSLDRLHKDGLIQYHKSRACASINPPYKEEVREVLRDEVPEYVLDLR
jgi:hypothetical protein